MANLKSDLREFIESLNSHRIEYLVVGGHAVAFHGHPRFTGDIDFFLRSTRDNALRVLDALRDFGFGDLQIGPKDLTTPGQVVQLGQPPNRIDLLTSISGVAFEEAWLSRVPGKLGGLTVNFIGWSALIKNKETADRDKDRADLAKLMAVAARRPSLQRPSD